MSDIAVRLASVDWTRVEAGLDADGYGSLGSLLDAADCAALIALYEEEARFRSRVIMARHGFGQGEYRYFAAPLPPVVEAMRTEAYARLAPLANRWSARMGGAAGFPPDHGAFLARCHAAGQTRPTPLLLRYGPGDHNNLHQDLCGEHVFPIQLLVLLSVPERDFSGGEFILAEARPRRQTRAEVVPLKQGEAVAFAVNRRPVTGMRGDYRATMRHGVSRVRSGQRHTLGVIFHDAA